ncbi:hypothetical protein OAG71_00660 [bacterium]|nr:hypothetical protein [bacterium]
MKTPPPKFSLRTLLLAVLAVGLIVPAVLTGAEYSRFMQAKNHSLSLLRYFKAGHKQACKTAISELSFAKRHDSIIAFAGYRYQTNGSCVLFVEWASFRTNADSIIVTRKDGKSITYPLTNVETDHDSGVYYHHSIFVPDLGLDDATEIDHVELARLGNVITESIAPEMWAP